MMKKWMAILAAAGCLLALSGCGQQKPSLDEVEQAINEGNVTIEDALDKGWITQDWVDTYYEENTVPSADKMESGAFGDFSTTTLSGDEFTADQMGDVTLFVFLDPNDPDAAAFYQALVDGYEGVKENGAEILVCTKSEDGNELFDNAPFPVILYNDSLKAATENHREMIEGVPNTASWCVNTSFLSAWFSSVEAEELADDAAAFVETQKDMGDKNSDETGGMAVMG